MLSVVTGVAMWFQRITVKDMRWPAFKFPASRGLFPLCVRWADGYDLSSLS